MGNLTFASEEYKPIIVKEIYDEQPSPMEVALQEPGTYILGVIAILLAIVAWKAVFKKA